MTKRITIELSLACRPPLSGVRHARLTRDTKKVGDKYQVHTPGKIIITMRFFWPFTDLPLTTFVSLHRTCMHFTVDTRRREKIRKSENQKTLKAPPAGVGTAWKVP